jgi:GNAT superfamily N-acetyltransferase
MADWQIERLARHHERSGFSCGKPPLDDFILRLVTQYEKRNLGRTYVAVRQGESQIRGYYTLASGAVPFQNLPEPAAKKLPKHPVPVVLLARLAVDQSAQGQGLGEALLLDALRRSASLADKLGIHAVEVDAIDQQAKCFYEKHGFVPLLDDKLHLFLPTATIHDVFERKTGKS